MKMQKINTNPNQRIDMHNIITLRPDFKGKRQAFYAAKIADEPRLNADGKPKIGKTPVGKPITKLPPLIAMSDIQAKRTHWLWEPYIPENVLTMIFAKGGVGKGHLTSEIAARLSKGEALPGEEDVKREPLKVLMLRVEDDTARVTKPQLMAAGADMDMVLAPNGKDTLFTLDETGLARLAGWIDAYGVKIITIDPIVSYVGGKVNSDKANQVRAILQPLANLAQAKGVTIIVVAHANKAGGRGKDALMGSADFVNAVRSVIQLRDDEDGRTFEHVKSNMGPRGDTHLFSIEDEEVMTDEGEIIIGHFIFGPNVDDEFEQMTGKTDKEGKAKVFLRTILANGSMDALEVMAMAEKEGISKSTLNRAKPSVAQSVRVGEEKARHWELLPHVKGIGVTLH